MFYLESPHCSYFLYTSAYNKVNSIPHTCRCQSVSEAKLSTYFGLINQLNCVLKAALVIPLFKAMDFTGTCSLSWWLVVMLQALYILFRVYKISRDDRFNILIILLKN